ncbi:MAG TPA: UvrD-helicase domain-containing protein [Phycisphaerae bacterium]|jgi:DNA helicase-2/ATP-dependent DNA helicase PcrA|nr:UvrD-helicase domain-containing protein [Phycisphaerae bacterium]HOB73902.1 UvrD-helicase domain-containing protein [Phycisphaerae bacterium]HOJ56163.1 UvrD-helicase domain-containing protein [Phycisphaerae bacterium]HOL28108.1 UvrD-helicase domain-containing protein [Phycisphaerae bacterium]HPP19781.1 UvrD-helicase domain-containing protein [Phycisphaerae bacterium]
MEPDELLEGLTEPQREAVVHGDGPLLVLAGPGSGKTRVITHRAAYLARTITHARHILAITFTNKAAREMAERMERLDVGPGLTCSTFHSFCARSLRMYGDRAGIKPNFSIFDEADQQQAMKAAIRQAELSEENFTPARMLHKISRLKNAMILAEDFAQQAQGWEDRAVARIYLAYQQVLKAQNALDFDDLLVEMALLLGRDPELRDHLNDRYRYVLVDEYQDTNHAQYLIARGLALNHENLCVTGDPDQSIYAWRGANLQNILQFEEDFPKAKVIRLEENFRSTPQILDAADAVIKHNRKRKRKALFTCNPAGPPVRVARCEDQHAESAFVAREIKKHVNAGGRYDDVAIFYRTNALSRNIEAALRNATIPYQIARGVAFFQRTEVKDVLAYLKVVANPLDTVSLERIINTPARKIGKTSVERLFACARQRGRPPQALLERPEDIPDIPKAAVKGMKSLMSLLAGIAEAAEHGAVRDAVEYVVMNSGLLSHHHDSADSSAVENMNELISAAAQYDRQHPDGDGSLTDWLTQVALVSDVDAIDPEVGAVTLMTLHAAKGLEFNHVFMVGLEDGLLPHQRSREENGDIEEERRLCFVGMTRARRALTMTYAKWRESRGISQRTTGSQFLHELPREGIEQITVHDEEEEWRYDREVDEAPLDDAYEWREGQMVRHPDYGTGQIQALEWTGRGTRARVRFKAIGDMTIYLQYSNLEPLEFEEMD